MNRRRATIFVVVGFGAAAAPLLANGGTLRVADVPIGGYEVSVFTDPTPARPDTLHVSVLVLNEGSGTVAEGVEVTIGARARDGLVMVPTILAMRDTDDPRYYHNHFVLPHAGVWEIVIAVSGERGDGETRFELAARMPGPLNNPIVLVFVSLIPLLAAGWWLLRGSSGTPAASSTSPNAPR
jgi:hypothetical protein